MISKFLKTLQMKTRTKTLVTVLILLTISCKKENTIQSTGITMHPLTDNIELSANTVKIGTQVWKKENLNVSHYRNGDLIPEVKSPDKWSELTTGAWCWYKNDSANGAVYGKLYNWYAVNDSRGIVPAGWHVPSDEEWATLTMFLGGINVAGGKMKATGTIQAGTGLWRKPNANATNSSGFTALPGGSRNPAGLFQFIGKTAYWWSSNEFATSSASLLYINYYDGSLNNTWLNKKYGFYIRCIKD